ncbi:hypothetical protein FACS1894172_09410 [Spirochaetia bacterium]|nr:hypothetical protein FACS1894172_09410 [Spirochaetia bacterium]
MSKMNCILFTAAWCPACPAMHSIWAAVRDSGDFPEIEFIECSQEQSPEPFAQYKILSLPSIVFIHPDGYEFKMEGLQNEFTLRNQLELLVEES